jgi:outer membrane protein assembly factor BamB
VAWHRSSFEVTARSIAVVCGIACVWSVLSRLPSSAEQRAAASKQVATAARLQNFPSAQLWSKPIPAKPIAAAAPVAAGDRIFLALESGISARRMLDGEEIWKRDDIVDRPMAASTNYLVIQSKGVLTVLDAASGTLKWTTDQVGPITAPPLVHDDWLFVAAADHFTAYQVSDGTERWTRDDLGTVEQRPAIEGAHMYVSVTDGRLLALTVNDGKTLWTQEVGIKPTEPLIYGDRIFIGSAAKFFYSLKMQDGTPDWPFPVGAAVFGRAAADAKHVYFVAYDNLLRAHDRRRGQLVWKAPLKYRPSAGPTIVGNSVSAPGVWTELSAYDTTTGKPTGELKLGDKIAVVPVFIDAPNGTTNLAAITGNLEDKWTLTLSVPPPMTPPSVPIVPLTVLPGQVVRPGAGLALPGALPRGGGHLQ